jgi:mono/diheme cytochrome c family protein
LNSATPPPYSSRTPGDPQRGAAAYRTYCSSCHGVDGRGGKASSIVDGAYLALVSDQELRTIVIAGRPELGAPDWRGDVEGRPMSAEEISDVVAWLSRHRPQFPGQPYPISSMDGGKGGLR